LAFGVDLGPSIRKSRICTTESVALNQSKITALVILLCLNKNNVNRCVMKI
jgi:hypothetical protein